MDRTAGESRGILSASAELWRRFQTSMSRFSYKAITRRLSGLNGSFSRGLRKEPIDLCYLFISKTSFICDTVESLSR